MCLRRLPQFSCQVGTTASALRLPTLCLQQEQEQHQQFTGGASDALLGASSSCSSSLMCGGGFVVASCTPLLAEAQRFLRVARTPFGYYIRRRGQFSSHWPRYRKPFNSNRHSGRISPVNHWRQFAPHDSNYFLPKHNYVTGDWNGLFVLPLDQVYTLHHCTANVPMRVRRFPTTFEFKTHSRWMIGKAVKTWVENRAQIFDEAGITKRTRLALVKQGLLPPG